MVVLNLGNLKFAKRQQPGKLVSQAQRQSIALFRIPITQPASVRILKLNLQFVRLPLKVIGITERNQIRRDICRYVLVFVRQDKIGHGNWMSAAATVKAF